MEENNLAMSKISEELSMLKTRFSPQFIQKIEKTFQSISAIQYDLEVQKMNSVSFALKKDVDSLDGKFAQFVEKKNFAELKSRCELFAEIEMVEKV